MSISSFGGRDSTTSDGSGSTGENFTYTELGQLIYAVGGANLLPTDGRIVAKSDYPDLHQALNGLTNSPLMSFTSASKTGLTTGSWIVAYAPELKMFCAVNGNNIQVSFDGGQNWSAVANGITSSSTTLGLVWTGSFFCAVNSSESWVSPNGSTWTKVTLPKTLDANCVMSWDNNELTVHSSAANIHMKSPDGVNWSIKGIPLASVHRIIKSNGRYIAISQTSTNQVAVSSDGVEWAARTLPATEVIRGGVGNAQGFCVMGTTKSFTSPDGDAWTANDLGLSLGAMSQMVASDTVMYAFATVASAPQFIRKSTDGGITWTQIIDSGSMQSTGTLIPYSSNGSITVVAVPGTAMLLRSFDRVTWSLQQLPIASDWSACFWNGTDFVLLPSYGGTSLRSTDGQGWVTASAVVPTPSGGTNWRYVTKNTDGSVYIAVPQGTSNSCMVSNDGGITWTAQVQAATITAAGIAYGNGSFVVLSSTNNVSNSTTDGITWATRSVTASAVNSLSFNGTVFCAVTTSGASFASSNGINWYSVGLPASNQWYDVAFGNGVWVMAATNGSFAVSKDGMSWTPATLPANSLYRAICFGGGLFVAVTYNGNTVVTSPDGFNWTVRTLPYTAYWCAIAHNGTSFAIVGGNSGNNNAVALQSSDGITWNQRTIVAAQWACLSVNGGTFVALASTPATNGAATSTDGITWTTRNQVYGMAYTKMIYAHGMHISISNSSQGLTTPDGITWTLRSLSTTANWISLATNGTTTVAVAQGSTTSCMTTTNGTTWTSRAGLPASIAYNAVFWNGSVFVATVTNSTTVYTSPDGITWTQKTSGYSGGAGAIVGWNGTNFVAVTNSNNAFISTDGLSWTAKTGMIPTTGTAIGGAQLKFDGSTLYYLTSMPSTGLIMLTSTSVDSSTVWNSAIVPAPYNATIKYVANGTDVISLVGRQVGRSVNGAPFQYAMLPSSLGVAQTAYATPVWNGLAYYAPSSSTAGTDNPGVLRSADGVNWTKFNAPMNTPYDAMWVGSRLVLTQTSGMQSTEDDGANWTTTSIPSVNTASYNITLSGFVEKGWWFFNLVTPGAITYFNPFETTDGKTVASRTPFQGSFTRSRMASDGARKRVYVNESGYVSTSLDGGQTYVQRTLAATKGITYNATLGMFVALGSGAGTAAYASTDGVNWVSRVLPSSSTWSYIASAGRIMVAFCESATTGAYSTNGITWNALTIPSSTWASAATDGTNMVFGSTTTTMQTIARNFDPDQFLQLPNIVSTPSWYVKAK